MHGSAETLKESQYGVSPKLYCGPGQEGRTGCQRHGL